MTTPSVPRCGRMDEHEPHAWSMTLLNAGPYFPARTYTCPGTVIHEGGARCQHCGHVVCTCDAELAQSRNDEWWSE